MAEFRIIQGDLNPWRVFETPPYGWCVQDARRNWYPSSEQVARRFAAWMFRRWLRDSELAQRLLERRAHG